MLEKLSPKRSVVNSGTQKHQEALMNHSICSADRTTHLKIVVVTLAASIGIAGFGIAAHFKAGDQNSRTAYVVKAGKPSLRFAVALPGRQDTLSDLTFVNGSPALSGIQSK
jgi:hypothetical protein